MDNPFKTKLNLLFALILFASPSAFAAVTAWQEVELRNGHVLVDVEIAGVPAKALLDTGATSMAISLSFLEDNSIDYVKGEEYTVLSANGKSRTHKIRDIEVSIFGMQLPIRNANSFKDHPRHQMLIGMPFLRLVIVQIDYPNRRIRFFSRDSIDLANQANVESRVEAMGSRLVTSVGLGGEDKVDLLFDTGATAGITIDRRYAENRGWLEEYRLEEKILRGVNYVTTADLIRLPYLKLGPYELENVKVIVPREPIPTVRLSRDKAMSTSMRRHKKGASYVGALGADVLKHFVVTIDAKNALIHIAAP